MPDFLGKGKNIIEGNSDPQSLVEDKKQLRCLIYFGNETINPNLPEK